MQAGCPTPAPEHDGFKLNRHHRPRHCKRSEALQGHEARTGLLPPSLFELRRTQSSQELLAMTELAIPIQFKAIVLQILF